MNSSVSENVTVSLLEATSTDKPITKNTALTTVGIVIGVIAILLIVLAVLWICMRVKKKITRFGDISIPSPYLDDEIRRGPYGQDDTITNLLPVDSKTCINSGDSAIYTNSGDSSDSAVGMGRDSSDGHEMKPVVFQISSYNPHSATERTGYGCLETVAESETINEVCNDNVSYSRRSVMALVKAPTGNSASDLDETIPKSILETRDIDDIDYKRLDWDSVFTFLTDHLEGSRSRIFLHRIYAHTTAHRTVDVGVKLDQVEQNALQKNGSGDIKFILLEQYKAWKQFAGRNAKVTCIYDALQDIHRNDIVEEFRAYMRTPPMRQSNLYTSQTSINQSSQGLQNSIEYPTTGETSLQLAPPIGTYNQRPLQNVKVNRKYEESYELCFSQPNNDSIDIARNELDGERASLCNLVPQEEEQTALKSTTNEVCPDKNVEQCGETKELRDEACSSYKQKKSKLLSSNVKRKGKCFKPSRIRKKTSRKRKTKVNKLHGTKLTKKSFHLFVKTFLQSTNLKLERDMYHIYLRQIIPQIVKETGNEKNEILSLTCSEFDDSTELETRRETIRVMYSGASRVVLEQSTYEDLLCYKNKARVQIVNRLGENIDQESQKYLFIDYDGNSFLEKETEGDKADETDSDGSSCLTVEEESVMSDEEHNEETDVLASSISGIAGIH